MCRLLIHAICGLELEKSWFGGENLLLCERFEEVDLDFKSLMGFFFFFFFLQRFDLFVERDWERNRYICTLFEFGPFVNFFFLVDYQRAF